MAICEILIYPDQRLKTRCAPVAAGAADVDTLIQNLVDTMLASGHSVGVAAPQIGDLRRVAVVDVSRSKLGRDNHHGLLTMVNPEIISHSGQKVMREGCMSVPDYTGDVDRATEITLQFSEPDGTPREIIASGFEAVAIQHEMDHLDGVLFLDRVTSIKTGLFRRKNY
jgi:peptide deformylase